MAKFQSPLLGYNNNVRHKNRVFHIQTEDSGVNHPHIITHLFMDGGRILKSVKKSYAEHVGADGMQETVRGLMKEQHKAIFIALRDGQFDSLVDSSAAIKAAGSAALPPAAKAAPATTAASVGVPPDAGGSSPVGPVPPSSAPELSPITIDETKRLGHGPILPPPQAEAPPMEALLAPPTIPQDVARTTRRPPTAQSGAPLATKSARELTLDFDALEQAGQDAATPSLFHANDLPPPPKNLFAKEPGTGAYRAVEANAAHEARHDGRRDTREEPAGRSDPRDEADAPLASNPGRVPPSRSRSGEARYAPARPAAIFGSTQRPAPQSILSEELVSDKSLDEVILSYLAEDLEPPRRK